MLLNINHQPNYSKKNISKYLKRFYLDSNNLFTKRHHFSSFNLHWANARTTPRTRHGNLLARQFQLPNWRRIQTDDDQEDRYAIHLALKGRSLITSCPFSDCRTRFLWLLHCPLHKSVTKSGGVRKNIKICVASFIDDLLLSFTEKRFKHKKSVITFFFF